MRGMRKNYDVSELPGYMYHLIKGPNRGYTYFLVSDDLSIVKIGGTNDWEIEGDSFSFDAEQRVSAVRQGCPVPLRLAAMLPGVPYGNETSFHRHFKSYRYEREWYWYLDDLREYIDLVADYASKFEEYVSACEDHRKNEKEAEASRQSFQLPMPVDPGRVPVLDFSTPPAPLKKRPSGWQLKLI